MHSANKPAALLNFFVVTEKSESINVNEKQPSVKCGLQICGLLGG